MIIFKSPLVRSAAVISILFSAVGLCGLIWPMPLVDAQARAKNELEVTDVWADELGSSFESAKARPLFHENRRYAVAQQPIQTQTKLPNKKTFDFKLVGILGNSSTERTAYLQNETTQETVSVRVDDLVDGWTVEQISERGMSISSGEDNKFIELSGGT